MGSHEADSQPPKPEARPTPRTCADLQQVIENHERFFGGDAFYVFLQIHHCICCRMEGGEHVPALRELNGLLVERCIDVYDHWYNRNPIHDALSEEWVHVLFRYQTHPRDYYALLPRMAAAHILNDLARVLFYVEVHKDDYDAAFGTILSCAQAVGALYFPRDTFADKILFAVKEVLDPLGKYAIWQMRELAWDMAQKRKALARSRGPLERERVSTAGRITPQVGELD